MSLLADKCILVTGILSKKSIAYGIAEQCRNMGSELILTYQNERFESRIKDIASELGSALVYPCDVTNDEQIDTLFNNLEKNNLTIDGLVHAVAYAPRDAIGGSFLSGCSRNSFQIAHDVSAYSLVALVRGALRLMTNGGSVVAMTYLGSERAVPNYNTMGLAKASLEAAIRYTAYEVGSKGVRVNGISAGPIRTIASSGIEDFSNILKHVSSHAPLKRNVTLDDISGTAGFLLSSLSSGITGEILYVDCGYRTVLPIG
ncbi:enoyl-ACP reductase FabI [Candidatus Ichthyocystis sparus]|nr:enoyl-ACP reductase [Candidatus Ichthyocystis sparus]